MKQIMEAYGRFLLAGAAFVLVFSLVFFQIRDGEGNRGALNIIGAGLSVSGTDYAGYVDFNSYLAEGGKGMPSIVYEYAGKLYAGEDMPAADFIKARDASGQTLALRILEVTDHLGNDLTSCYDKTTGEICFPDGGVYEIRAAVKDAAEKAVTCSVAVPVNER